MQSQKQMIVLSVYSVLAGLAPWLAWIYRRNLERALCGEAYWGGGVMIDYNQINAYLQCAMALFNWAWCLSFLLAFTTILVGIISFRRRKDVPTQYTASSLFGCALGLGFLLIIPLLVLIFSTVD